MAQKRINGSGLHTIDVKSSRILAAAVKRSEAIFTARSLEANATCFTECKSSAPQREGAFLPRAQTGKHLDKSEKLRVQ
jgi:hypothetical protein